MRTVRPLIVTILLALALLAPVTPGRAPVGSQASAAASGARAAHAVLISLDGARPDAMQQAGGDALARRGSYTWEAQTTYPSSTMPAHASMITGVGPERHGITFNTWTMGQERIGVATMFDWAKRAGLRTAMLVSKPKLQFLARPGAPEIVEVMVWPRGRAEPILRRAAQVLTEQRPHLMWVHVTDPDVAGHDRGWMSAPYMEALQRSVAAVATFLKRAEDAGLAAQTAVVITADHGGHSRLHGSRLPEDMKIPWVALGAGIKPAYRIARPVVVYDTAPTLLQLLGVPFPRNWDGRAVTEIFR